MAYEDSMKYYWDLKNSLDTKLREGEKIGFKKGRTHGRVDFAVKLLYIFCLVILQYE
jgi:hypothetical protein